MSGKCKNCSKFLRKDNKFRKIIKTKNEAEKYSHCFNKNISVSDVICNKCRLSIYKQEALTSRSIVGDTDSDSDPMTVEPVDTNNDDDFMCRITNPEEDNYIEMPFPRVVSTHRFCIICRAEVNLRIISLETRCDVFARKKIFIPDGDRCCNEHMIGGRIYEDDLSRLCIISNTSRIKKSELVTFLNILAETANLSLFDRIENGISEDQLKALTGLTWENVIELKHMLPSMRSTKTRSVTQALIVFLFKLRTGNSNRTIAAVLGLQYEQYVSEFFNEVVKGFKRDILPLHFSYSAIVRQDLISNTSSTAKKLLNLSENQLVIICDGTYVQHQKSQNNFYQRKSFSGQKKMHLCKPFTICTTNGYIIDFAGPFYGTQNDASILKLVLQNSTGLQTLLSPNDIFIVDRGFRDSVDLLQSKGYTVLMPALKGNRPQLTTEEANESRRVTKLRWVVEAVHGAIAQKYRLLHNSLDNKFIPKLKVLCKIVGFLQNKYGQRFNSHGDNNDEVLEYMESRMSVVNTLSEEVIIQKWNRRKSAFQQLTSSEILDFPQLSKQQLAVFFTGSYQLSQAVSYLAEIMDEQYNLTVQFVKTTPSILKLEVRSRHVNSKAYHVYIDYVPNGTTIQSIRRYCCNCPNGLRTVGCCSHIAAVVYYLSYARYLSRILRPAQALSDIFTSENIHAVINEDSDED